MTDHIGDGNQMVPDLDALKKLADAFDSGAYSTSGAMARTYGAGGKIRAAQDIKALIAELKEARGLLEPFAHAAPDLDDETGDHEHIWEQPAAMSISAGNLRAARAFLSKAQGGE